MSNLQHLYGYLEQRYRGQAIELRRPMLLLEPETLTPGTEKRFPIAPCAVETFVHAVWLFSKPHEALWHVIHETPAGEQIDCGSTRFWATPDGQAAPRRIELLTPVLLIRGETCAFVVRPLDSGGLVQLQLELVTVTPHRRKANT